MVMTVGMVEVLKAYFLYRLMQMRWKYRGVQVALLAEVVSVLGDQAALVTAHLVEVGMLRVHATDQGVVVGYSLAKVGGKDGSARC